MEKWRFIYASNPFKGTMSAQKACQCMKAAVDEIIPDNEGFIVPMADGGEGTTECMLSAAGGKKRTTLVKGPFGHLISASYGILPGNIGVCEAAEACGLTKTYPKLDPEATTSYGLGELIQACIDEGCKKIYVGLGGTATNDGGAGLLSALGAVFLDNCGRSFVPIGGSLKDIRHVSLNGLRKRLEGIEIIGMCDVFAPLFGKKGAAHLYSRQKGASSRVVERLENGMASYAKVLEEDLGVSYDDINDSGCGAAGGIGMAIKAVIQGHLTSGAEAIIEASKFDELAKKATCVFTGEGRVDVQTLQGKGTFAVCRHCKILGVPCICVAGSVGHGYDRLYQNGLSAVFTTDRSGLESDEAKLYAESDLYSTIQDVARLIKSVRSLR